MDRMAQPMPGKEDCSAQLRVQPGYPWNCSTRGCLPSVAGTTYLA